MSYKTDFDDITGWSAVDTNVKTSLSSGKKFIKFLEANGVNLILRYYASSKRKKTISDTEARLLSKHGFAILPIYQDNARNPADFGTLNGKQDAKDALEFADYIGQPDGSSILFAVDTDFTSTEISKYVMPYFRAVREVIDGRFRIGAYGSGLTLSTLQTDGLIEIPWLSMSPGFAGTKSYLYSNDWAFRQLRPPRREPASGHGYDMNVLNWPLEKLGAFRLDENGNGEIVGKAPKPAKPGPVKDALDNKTLFVATEGLKFRDAPNGAEDTEMTINTKLVNLGVSSQPKWQKVQLNGDTGFAFRRYLRESSTSEVEDLMRTAIDEWLFFKKGSGDEKDTPFKERVGDYWKKIGFKHDGATTYVDKKGVTREMPWSAAFISWAVLSSGAAYAEFGGGHWHSMFVHRAIQGRLLENKKLPFWGYPRDAVRPEIGDIVQRWRTEKYTFGHAETHEIYASHSDIVVEVRGDIIRVLGGNVGDTVATETGDDTRLIQEYALNNEGFIKSKQRVISVLKNRAHLV